MNDRKVVLIGLDCATRVDFIEKYMDELPTIKKLYKRSIGGALVSCTPPITIPAWRCMTTGLNPDTMNVFGFRDRERGSAYQEFKLNYSERFKKFKNIWDYVEEHGGKSIVLGVPSTYPVEEIDGCMVSGFLSSDVEDKRMYHPSELREEVLAVAPFYKTDVDISQDKDKVREEIYEMTDSHFKTFEYMIENKEWDFAMMVAIGLDRLHHKFYFDELYGTDKPFLKYYKQLDTHIADVLEKIPDDTYVILASDHGYTENEGTININEWLRDNGYQVWTEEPTGVCSYRDVIDFERSKAWTWGGYQAPVFLNVEGREPNGVIPEGEYAEVRHKLIKELSSELSVRIIPYQAEELYDSVPSNTPDILAYSLCNKYRFTGKVGFDSYVIDNDGISHETALHSPLGMYLLYDNNHQYPIRKEAHITDIAPTVLSLMGIDIEPDAVDGYDILKPSYHMY